MITGAVRDLYVARWGEPSRKAAFRVAGLELPDGMHVEFMQAIPVFESELAYKARHGARELLEHWQESGVAFWNPGRLPEPALA